MNSPPYRYFILNKPINIVSQFISDSPRVTLLGAIEYNFPEGTHAVGRLDNNSEGLLLLTTDKRITGLLFHPSKKHIRTYLVMVNDVMTAETLAQLRKGVSIKLKKGGTFTAIPAGIEIIENPLYHYPFAQDERSNTPHTWLLISLTEGKYHQVRQMVLIVGHRCLRLIRISIENLQLGDLSPGEVKEITQETIYCFLCLNDGVNLE